MSGKIIAFGSYDTRKPRVRLLLDAIRRAGALAEEIPTGDWERVAQTNVPSRLAVAGVMLRMIRAYPRAIVRLLRSEKGAAILLPYPGILDIFLISPLAKATGRRLVFDAFLPLYDTIVVDRALVRGGGIAAHATRFIERAALRLADLVIVDTDSHGDYFAREFGIERDRFVTVLVGAEPQFSPAARADPARDILGPDERQPIVLFYGQLIPLHGLPTILAAARAYDGPPARWIVIGRGQLEPLMREAMEHGRQDGGPLEWIEWVDYKRLPAVIARAAVCLGVFGASDKAARVIPNKLFQQLAVGKPVITRTSPAVDGLAGRFPGALRTIAPDDPQALASAVAEALSRAPGEGYALPPELRRELSPDAGVARLLARLDQSG